MKIGHVIRAERVRQDMKQIVLAKGICTPSYLSKIERNLIDPSEEVVELLMKRLGMDVGKFKHPVQSNSEQEFSKLLKDSYREVITKRDKAFTKQQLDLLLNENPLFYDQSIYYTYLLITLRFRLILGEELDERKKEIDALDELVAYFDEFQLYMYNLNKALFYYSSKIYIKSIECFESIFPLLESLSLDKWESAEFHYMIGVAYIADNRILHSIEHVRKALTYFREHFLMKRVMDCYILIGVTQKQSNNFHEALDAYIKAQQICEEFGLEHNKGIIFHNIGALYSVMGDSEQAIDFYKVSINDKYEKKKGQLISIFCLVLEYSKLNNKALVLEWCNSGIALYRLLEDESLASYYHQLTFIKSLHSEQGLSETVAKTSISYFKKVQDYQLVNKYCIALGEWYYANSKYKLSSLLYAEANKYGNIYRNIKKWEDL